MRCAPMNIEVVLINVERILTGDRQFVIGKVVIGPLCVYKLWPKITGDFLRQKIEGSAIFPQ